MTMNFNKPETSINASPFLKEKGKDLFDFSGINCL